MKNPWEWIHSTLLPMTPEQLAKIAEVTGQSYARVLQIAQTEMGEVEVWANQLFRVNLRRYQVEEQATCVHLAVAHLKHGSAISWEDLQRIKNEVVGRGCEAVELFPAEERRIDVGGMRHLWCMPAGHRLPLGFQAETGDVAEIESLFKPEHKEVH